VKHATERRYTLYERNEQGELTGRYSPPDPPTPKERISDAWGSFVYRTMNDMPLFALCYTILVLTLTITLYYSLVFIGSNTMSNQCRAKAEIMDMAYHYDFESGCMIMVDGQYRPIESLYK